jgi:hypothetical protein
MSIMKFKRTWVNVGELPEEEQRNKVYRTLAGLEREFGRPVTDTEIKNECNRKYNPENVFDSTQVGVRLSDLENLGRIESKPIEIRGKNKIGYYVKK